MGLRNFIKAFRLAREIVSDNPILQQYVCEVAHRYPTGRWAPTATPPKRTKVLLTERKYSREYEYIDRTQGGYTFDPIELALWVKSGVPPNGAKTTGRYPEVYAHNYDEEDRD